MPGIPSAVSRRPTPSGLAFSTSSASPGFWKSSPNPTARIWRSCSSARAVSGAFTRESWSTTRRPAWSIRSDGTCCRFEFERESSTAKLSLLAWSRHIRIIVASANLTEPGYRTNHEVAATVDLSPSQADGDLLMQAITFLRDLLALVPGAQDARPEVQRASAYLSRVERHAEAWKSPRQRSEVRRQLACTLPAIELVTNVRSSLDEAVAFCRQRGGSPHEAWVASPFFDVDDDSGRVATALCKSMARGRTREIWICVPASRDDSETAVPRLAAPKAVATTPLGYRGHVTVSTLPDFDGDKNHRPWHAKMLALRAERYTALMIGSSNFTCAGMGGRVAPERRGQSRDGGRASRLRAGGGQARRHLVTNGTRRRPGSGGVAGPSAGT